MTEDALLDYLLDKDESKKEKLSEYKNLNENEVY